MKLRHAMVCAFNQNRSMEAHALLKKHGFDVSSYGTGAHMKMLGTSIRETNVYELYQFEPFEYRVQMLWLGYSKFDVDPKTRYLLLYDVNMNCIKSMNEAHKSIRREPNSIDNTHIKTTS